MAIKSSRGVTSGKGTPQRLEGQNGDITIRTTSSGKKLFVKDANKWHAVNLDVNTSDLHNKINALLKDVRSLKNSTRNRPVLDSAILRKPGSASVLLKNDSATFSVRNADDTADVSIKAEQLKISGGTAAEAGDITRTPKTDSTTDIVTIATNNLFIPGALTGELVQTAVTIQSNANQDAVISLGDTTPNWVMGLDVSDNNGVTGSASGKFKIHATTDSTLPDAADFELDIDGNLLTAGTITDGNGNASNMFYDVQKIGYHGSATANYIPMTGGLLEKTSTADSNETLGFVAPYNGSVHQVQWRSEVAQNGTTTLKIYESADGTEVPGSLTGQKDESINIADDTTHTYNLSSMTSGNTNLVKGRIYALYISHPSAPQDTNATVVFKWDVTT